MINRSNYFKRKLQTYKCNFLMFLSQFLKFKYEFLTQFLEQQLINSVSDSLPAVYSRHSLYSNKLPPDCCYHTQHELLHYFSSFYLQSNSSSVFSVDSWHSRAACTLMFFPERLLFFLQVRVGAWIKQASEVVLNRPVEFKTNQRYFSGGTMDPESFLCQMNWNFE